MRMVSSHMLWVLMIRLEFLNDEIFQLPQIEKVNVSIAPLVLPWLAYRQD